MAREAKLETKPWHPAPWTVADIYAVKAVYGGTANPSQQKKALDWILHNVCAISDLSFRPGAEEGRRDTDFAEGKRFVGSQIVKAVLMDAAILENEGKKQNARTYTTADVRLDTRSNPGRSGARTISPFVDPRAG